MVLGVSDIVAPASVTNEPHVLLLCTNFMLEFKRVKRVHISLYQQSRCLKETNETKGLAMFSACLVLHSKN